MASWFECKVRYDKLQENGAVKIQINNGRIPT